MARGKRILVFGSYAPSLIHFRGTLIADMAKRGHSVLAAAPEIDGHVAESLRKLGAEPRQIPLRNVSLNPLALFKSYKAARALLREAQPDIILAYTIKPVIVAALAGRAERTGRIVSLITGAGYAFTGGREPRRVLSKLAATFLYRRALKRSDVVIFQNPDDRDLFVSQKIVRPCQAVVLPGSGVDLSHFVPDVLPRDLSFLMIGRLLRDKGVYEFVEAARKLKARLPDATFSILGEIDPQNPTAIPEHQIEQWTAQGVIEYAGSAHDVRPFIRRSSAIVLPSYREGLPRTLLEGAAMGRPLIGTDVPGCRQLVRDGSTGFLCRAADADSLAAAMERFAAMPYVQRARMGERARAMAEEEFDEGLVIGIYLDAAERLTSEAPDHARKPGR